MMTGPLVVSIYPAFQDLAEALQASCGDSRDPQRSAVLPVHLVVAVVVVSGGGVGPDTDVHQAERDRAAPHGPRRVPA